MIRGMGDVRVGQAFGDRLKRLVSPSKLSANEFRGKSITGRRTAKGTNCRVRPVGQQKAMNTTTSRNDHIAEPCI